ncbi:hypothetical protein OAP63_17045 [Vibrio sp.]|nr:hypothetical protein [Vibrio sp.]
MSFGMTNLSPSINVTKIVYDDKMIVAYISEDKTIELRSNPLKIIFTVSLFVSDNNRDIIVKHLRENIKNYDYFEVKTVNDFHNSEIFKSAGFE